MRHDAWPIPVRVGCVPGRLIVPRARARARPPSAAARRRSLVGWAILVGALLLLLLAPAKATGGDASAAAPAAMVNMEFRDTELATVLRAICQGAGIDFVLDPSVKGEVTAKLRNTTWQHALDIVLQSHGLEARRQGSTLLIAPAHPKAASEPEQTERRVVIRPRADGKLDFDASGAELREAVHELGAQAKLNIVTSKEIDGSVTASLHGLRAEEILLALADSVGAEVTDKGNLILLVPRMLGAVAEPQPPVAEKPPPVEIRRQLDGRLAIRARDASAREVFAGLASASGINVVASEKVTDTITLDLDGVTPEDALTAIATQAGLTIRPVGNILFAAPAPPDLQTQAFQLRYGDAKELGEALAKCLDGAKVAYVEASSLVVVTGPADVVAAARDIVERVEAAPTQVTIEARILETNLTGEERLGVEWSDGIGFSLTCPQIPHSWPLSKSKTSSYNPGYDPSDSRSRGGKVVPYADTEDFQFGFLTSTGLSAVLHLLEQQANTRMIAAPNVTVIEGKEAKINIATKFPIPQYQVSEETGVIRVSGFSYEDFGTILTVTPRVVDGEIVLQVHPEISRIAGTTTFQDAELPVVEAQEALTHVRVKDGQTLVIAGLIREDTEHSRKRVPWFGRIPIIGGLFRSRRSQVDQRRNLLIFITPHIVGEADFTRAARLKAERTEPLPTTEDDLDGPRDD